MKNTTATVRRNVSQVTADNQTVNFYEVSNGRGFRLETDTEGVFLLPSVVSALASLFRSSVAPAAQAQPEAPKKRVRRTKAQIAADNAAAAAAQAN